jgi:hypothetical protein
MASQDQIARKTVSLPESLWSGLADHRFHRRFPTETAALADVVARGLKAASVFGALANIATGRLSGFGRFTAAAVRTFGDGPMVRDLVAEDVRNWTIARGMQLTEAQIREKSGLICEAAERMAGLRAANGQAAILDVAVEELIEWAVLNS